MERLTYKEKDNSYSADSDYLANQKLGQLEDIEEELGIDLITLFRALYCGIWIKGRENYETEYDPVPCLTNNGSKGWCFIINEQFEMTCLAIDYIYIKDYGKTWALTKEEIEHDNRT